MRGLSGWLGWMPVLLGVWAHRRWREDGWTLGWWLTIGAYAVGVLTDETGFVTLYLVGAYELVGPGPRRARVRASFAVLCFMFLYVIVLHKNTIMKPGTIAVLIGAGGLLATAGLLSLCWSILDQRNRAEVRWWMLGAASALVVGLLCVPGRRALLVPAIGCVAVLSVVARPALRALAARRADASRSRYPRRA